eukprot:792638-Pelagomonas_calceolata.AAC.8
MPHLFSAPGTSGPACKREQREVLVRAQVQGMGSKQKPSLPSLFLLSSYLSKRLNRMFRNVMTDSGVTLSCKHGEKQRNVWWCKHGGARALVQAQR